MFKINAKVELNINDAMREIKKVSKDGVKKVSKVILDDCNEYVKEDSGELVRSSYKFSDLNSGDIVWNTPYAKKQYYTGEPNRSKKAKASKFWIHKAYSVNSKKWLSIIQSVIGGD